MAGGKKTDKRKARGAGTKTDGNHRAETRVSGQPKDGQNPHWYAACAILTILGGLWGGHWSANVVSLVGYILLPGYTILALIRWRSEHEGERFAVAAGVGLVLMLLVGWLLSTVGYRLGINEPLGRAAQTWFYVIILLCGSIYDRRHAKYGLPVFTGNAVGRTARHVFYTTALPVLALIGAEKLNRGNGNDLALAAMVGAWMGIALMILGAGEKRGKAREGGIVAGLIGTGLTIVWGTSLRGGGLFGWDIQKEYAVAEATRQLGRWSTQQPGDAYNAMLSISALPAQIHSLTGIGIESSLRYVYPVLLAAIGPMVYLTLRKIASRRASIISVALLLLAARAYPQQMPAVARQEVALYLFTCAISVLVGQTGAVRNRRWLFALLATAVAFTHYTSSYLVAAMAVAAGLVGYATRKRAKRGGNVRIITIPVAVCIAVVSFGWNSAVGGGAAVLDDPFAAEAVEKAKVLESSEGNLLQRWILGTGIRYDTVEAYQERLEAAVENELSWMDRDSELQGGEVLDSVAPRNRGPLAKWSGVWNNLTLLGYQATLLIIGISVLWLVLRKRAGLGGEVVVAAVVALIFSGALRVSDWLAAFYNPERGSFHAAIVLSIPVAIGIDSFTKRRNLVILATGALTLALTYSTWGLGAMTFSGKPRAAVASYGEDVERFIYSKAEMRAAAWLSENVEEGLVQSDRYGRVVLLNTGKNGWGNVDIMHPDFIDRRAWIFATRTNIQDGRARGYLDGSFAVYQSPVDRLERARAIVHATEYSRIYR